MVTNVTSLGRSGLSDWLIARVSAYVMTAYLIFIVGYLMLTPDLNYTQWAALNSSLPMRMFSLVTILSIAAHAWIGMWCVLTDYITVRLIGPKATALRIIFQLGMIAITLLYVIWAIDILWGI
ncbi:succinate dehydrogenase, hydrophobic membrane anchor protein [Porticoccaceae bacterium]|nr:succinate dehydrogenase, hydrophobic membrane anchor protein [Porticoccaceae bacterium]MDB4260507.1 succinate dehydrogenase, hydrophobic membrane anchor protein [Porticoccaceae bacterium]MDB9736829.1 succinate dehydrogenase, hydrophobic membrane anchor protein [Porticoccaceae bacterium]MDB9949281.1 succinate dehydrogenase, hydrophobic membrane anchor protein [Porticoccaceae bacterium]MDB9970093.1 succinate dehydrogenase, hydrophobic membrane anchor protein [Porticoccaceae bacterium]